MNDEFRMPNERRGASVDFDLNLRKFVIRASTFFRHSDFDIPHALEDEATSRERGEVAEEPTSMTNDE